MRIEYTGKSSNTGKRRYATISYDERAEEDVARYVLNQLRIEGWDVFSNICGEAPFVTVDIVIDDRDEYEELKAKYLKFKRYWQKLGKAQ